MPRRRSHGLNGRSPRTNLVLGPLAALALAAVAGCQAGPTDNGCQITKQVVIPGTTPLALLSEISVVRVGGTTVLLGSDTTSVRWVTIAQDGTVGIEQAAALPPDTLRAFYALAGVDSPGDRVVIGVLVANGSDADLRLMVAPTDDGAAAGAPGPAIATFGGGVSTPGQVAMGTSVSSMYAGVAWIDGLNPTYAFVDGQGAVVGTPAVIENALGSGYSCLGFAPGKQELTVTYKREPTDPQIGPIWLIADLQVGGAIDTLSLSVAQVGGKMSCAQTVLYDDNGSREYAIVWQDRSGSWLSVYYGPGGGGVDSYGFASSTIFGGADLQPPLMGLATFLGKDFGVLFAKPHSVELWRTDWVGNLRSGSLVFPSLQGDVRNVASVSSTNLLTSTYADYTGSEGRRLVIDASCY